MKKILAFQTVCVCAVLFVLISPLTSPVIAQEDPVFVLEGMGSDMILGQRAKSDWGHFWSGPAVSAINFGYLAENGYPNLASDHNGSGTIEASDLEPLSDRLGREYMNTVPEEGTTDPELLRGVARYINENYPEEFELKVFEDEFREEYQQIIGEPLPEKIFDVPIRVFTDPEFDSYEGELRSGEMVWVGVPQENSSLNHYLAGRSLDTRETLEGNFPVDFGDPRERSFQPGMGQIIETVMSEVGNLEYGDQLRPVDIMISLSPLERQAEGEASDGPDLVCSFDCEKKTEEVCQEYETEETECEEVCVDWGQFGEICRKYETVCEEEDRVCVEFETFELLECSTRVKNVGEEESGMTGGKIEAGDKENHFINTPLAPGEEQHAGEWLLGLEKFDPEDLTCQVDIDDNVEETNEENNQSTAAE